jgi:hypothetical protein
MSRVQEISMADSYESKLDAALRAIEALTTKIRDLDIFVTRVGTSLGVEISQTTQHVVVEGPTPLSSQGNNCSNQDFSDYVAKFREPRVSLLEKFDGIQSKG